MIIYRFPAPLLREKSGRVSSIDEEFISELERTRVSNTGCVGIAAPQVGVLKRVIIVDVKGHKKTKQYSGKLIMINPEVVSSNGSIISREGCLSVPDYTGNVERANTVLVRYMDETGRMRKLQTTGFEAVAIQHEIDHLDGILFIDRIKSIKRDLFSRS